MSETTSSIDVVGVGEKLLSAEALSTSDQREVALHLLSRVTALWPALLHSDAHGLEERVNAAIARAVQALAEEYAEPLLAALSHLRMRQLGAAQRLRSLVDSESTFGIVMPAELRMAVELLASVASVGSLLKTPSGSWVHRLADELDSSMSKVQRSRDTGAETVTTRARQSVPGLSIVPGNDVGYGVINGVAGARTVSLPAFHRARVSALARRFIETRRAVATDSPHAEDEWTAMLGQTVDELTTGLAPLVDELADTELVALECTATWRICPYQRHCSWRPVPRLRSSRREVAVA